MAKSGEITGNFAGNRAGGGIYVENSGSASMRGGLISENSANFGGGIFVHRNSTVIMTGGIISRNNAGINRGGGVHVHDVSSSFAKRAAVGSTTSGIIFGGTGADANIAGNGGHAVARFFGTLS